ncbi:MAG: hypothetical protein ACREVL_16515 [Solimonas sp.]
MSEKKPADWELAERLFRAGQLSLRLIAAQCRVTEGAIRKKAKKDGWKRDLTGKVQEAVRTALVRDQGTQAPARVPDPRTDKEIIEQAAASAVEVVRTHRGMLVKAGALSQRLFAQLDEAVINRGEIEETIHEEMDPQIQASTGPEKVALVNRRNRMLMAVSLPGHAGTLRDLSNAVKNFVTVERQSWGLDEKERKPEDPFDGLSDEQLAQRQAAIEREMETMNGGGK